MEDLGAITDTAAEVLPPVNQARSTATRRVQMLHSVWTEDRIAELRRLFFQVPVVSYRIIAKELGISRCAVAGKVKRLGLAESCPTKYAKRQPTVCKPARTSAGRTRKKRTTEARKRDGAAPDAEWVPSWRFPERPVNHGHPHPKPTEATDIVVDFVPPNPVRIWGLEEQHCRFILGEPSEMLFCGEPKRDQFGCPYCAFHMRITHQMSAPRKPWVPGRVEG